MSLRRTPLQRSTPLRSTKPIRRGGRLRAKSPHRVVEENGSRVPADVVDAVLRRSKGLCERCRKEPGTDLHHRLTRARGGPDDVFNLAHLCRKCHHVHAHGQNEHPWLIRGRIMHGVYTGPDDTYRDQYPPRT